MENLLNQIRGVVGVKGVIILDRFSGKSSVLMPASFDESYADGLKQKLEEIIGLAGNDALMRLKLAGGWAFVKTTPNYGFLILAKPELNISTLNLVLKSICVALEQSYDAREEKGEILFDKSSVLSLVKAVNLIGGHFSESISRFQIAELYRKSKSLLIDQHPDLKLFSVDHNGEVYLIKGVEPELNPSITDAVAEWMVNFKELVRRHTVIAGFDLKNITGEIQSDLEKLNFYRRFQKSSPR
jgi:hypothetical protein